MTWRQMVPTAVTLAAMLAGFFSILVTLESMDQPDAGQYHRWAAQLIMLAMILDGIDGNVARRLKGSSELGAELDTYVDMTAFGLAPALLIYVVSLQASTGWRVVMTSAVVMSGVVRLARFKAADPHRGHLGYTGLPITASAAWVSIFVLMSQCKPVMGWFSLNQGIVAAVFLTGVSVFIVLQVSSVRYPKPTKRMAIFIPCIILVLMLFWPWQPWQSVVVIAAASIIILLGLCYIAFGPLLFTVMIPNWKKRQAAKADFLNGNGE